jgi:hypothetical protein
MDDDDDHAVAPVRKKIVLSAAALDRLIHRYHH